MRVQYAPSGARVGAYGCSPCGRSDMFTGGERDIERYAFERCPLCGRECSLCERSIISKGDGVALTRRGDSRIDREMAQQCCT